MRAWEIERISSEHQIPVRLEDDNEALWEEQNDAVEQRVDAVVKTYWGSRVPGSLFRDTMAVAAVQARENQGTIVEDADKLLMSGFRAVTENDFVGLHKATHDIFEACRNAKKDEASDYWSYKFYETFDEYAAAVRFPKATPVDMDSSLTDKIYAGWLCQIIGGAYGTCLEGYNTDNIIKAYNSVAKYLRRPNTYNDDITYELALLVAYEQNGKSTTARDIAREWKSRIGFGWSAEDMALRNLRCGIYPPESGRFNNPYNEWIGAQMRGVILGQLYPGNPYMAAKAAWQDAEISHYHNGILGEVFNAVMCSMAFYEKDIRKVVADAVDLMPADSEYYSIVRQALDNCRKYDNWLDAWRISEQRVTRYNWVHAYPNAAIEVIALWYGNGDFNRTIEICGLCGQDVDCNAAQILTVWGTIYGSEAIPEYWRVPIGDKLDTYVRGMEVLSIKKLSARTAAVARALL